MRRTTIKIYCCKKRKKKKLFDLLTSSLDSLSICTKRKKKMLDKLTSSLGSLSICMFPHFLNKYKRLCKEEIFAQSSIKDQTS
jgi:hypothetical protein